MYLIAILQWSGSLYFLLFEYKSKNPNLQQGNKVVLIPLPPLNLVDNNRDLKNPRNDLVICHRLPEQSKLIEQFKKSFIILDNTHTPFIQFKDECLCYTLIFQNSAFYKSFRNDSFINCLLFTLAYNYYLSTKSC